MAERPQPGSDALGHRVARQAEAILARAEALEALSGEDLDALRVGLRDLLRLGRTEIELAEVERAERVLAYMLRPDMADCLTVWFGKSHQTDQDIAALFGRDVEHASLGRYDHWALETAHPRMLVALVILLDQFRRNILRDTPAMYARDGHCRDIVRRSLALGAAKRLRPVERVFLCLVLTHSEALEDQRLCLSEWDRTMAELALDDPLCVFHDIFNRHLAVIQRFGRFPHRNALLGRASTKEEEAFLSDGSFRFDLPLVRGQDGRLAFKRARTPRRFRVLDHDYETLLPEPGDAPQAKFHYEGPHALAVRGWVPGQPRIGAVVPDFAASTSLGPLRLYDHAGRDWCLVLAGPRNGWDEAAARVPAWRQRGVRPLGLALDGHPGPATLGFPVIADHDRQVAALFGLAGRAHHAPAAGAAFLVSPARRLELMLSYPAGIGCGFEEVARALDALQGRP
jgi:uncharacterized protein (DUF924 family)